MWPSEGETMPSGREISLRKGKLGLREGIVGLWKGNGGVAEGVISVENVGFSPGDSLFSLRGNHALPRF
jgi:hypothetical protein